MKAEEVLRKLIGVVSSNLDELKDYKDDKAEQFAYGAKCAYIECLEILTLWDEAPAHGLTFDIEEKYPI